MTGWVFRLAVAAITMAITMARMGHSETVIGEMTVLSIIPTMTTIGIATMAIISAGTVATAATGHKFTAAASIATIDLQVSQTSLGVAHDSALLMKCKNLAWNVRARH